MKTDKFGSMLKLMSTTVFISLPFALFSFCIILIELICIYLLKLNEYTFEYFYSKFANDCNFFTICLLLISLPFALLALIFDHITDGISVVTDLLIKYLSMIVIWSMSKPLKYVFLYHKRNSDQKHYIKFSKGVCDINGNELEFGVDHILTNAQLDEMVEDENLVKYELNIWNTKTKCVHLVDINKIRYYETK